ncbi:ABC transporter permease [Alicyclobacillaceae bacterium I2511]|nr:ABC transporter permease [Alicyclobacillaceae bacterium I2511]
MGTVVETKDSNVSKNHSFNALKNILNTSLVAAALVLLVIVFSVLSPVFLTELNLFHILQQVSIVGILAVGQAFVIITAGIDMSQGSIIGLTGVATALLMSAHYPTWVAILAGLLAGTLIGVLNGVLVTWAKLPPFIATLGTMSIGAGLALVITGGQPVFGIPTVLSNLGNDGIGSILPDIALLLIVIAVIFHFVLSRSRFGRYTYAIGSNPLAARLAGLNVKRQLIWIYIISGFLSAVGGIVMIAWVNSAMPSAGDNYQLNSIAAVVIGGGSLFGGQGTIWGSMVGALLMSVLSNGSQLVGISTYWQSVLLGLVVILAVFIDGFRQRSIA